MARKRSKKKIIYSIYALLAAAILWQGYALILAFMGKDNINALEMVTIDVHGTVSRPGSYRVPLGTTNFEVLQVAGVLPSSNISPFNLAAQVESGEELSVGELDNPVSVTANVRLEFYLGDISVISSEGIDRLSQEGMNIDKGDRILTEEDSQAELSLNTFSRIDLDDFSELSFDKIDIDENGRSVVEAFQKIGIAWYKIAFTDKFQYFKTVTPMADIVVSGKGSDFTIEVKYSEVIINVLDGLLLIESQDGSDAINLITGQTVTIYNDGRPFQVSKLATASAITSRFNRLAKTKAELLSQHMPLNILFCGTPNVYMLINIQFTNNTINIVQIPRRTSVSLYVHGFSTLQEAALYGGPVLASTLVERIMNTRIPHYSVFEKSDIIQTAAAIGGIRVELDNRAATIMKRKRGEQHLKGMALVEYLRPSLSGFEDSEKRQISALKSIFNQIRSKNLIITSLLAKQVLAQIESNLTASDILKHYNNFISRKQWTFNDFKLPVIQKKEKNSVIFEPDLEKSRKLLFEK